MVPSSLFLRRLLDLYESNKQLHVYDSFNGLPDKTIEDASVTGSDFKAGELKVSKRELIKNFKRSGLALPYIHKGWFYELKDKDIPKEISFAFLDGDFYNSIMESLLIVWPRLNHNGQIIIDDFEKNNLPGVSRAVNEFFHDKDITITLQKDLAIIKKP